MASLISAKLEKAKAILEESRQEPIENSQEALPEPPKLIQEESLPLVPLSISTFSEQYSFPKGRMAPKADE
jgi:hypothetical protein